MSERHSVGGATIGRNERGSTTSLLLLVLLLVIAAGGYLYYFTDFIRPGKEAAKSQPAQSAQVKQAIPPRAAQPGETPVAKPAAPGAATVPPAPAASPATPPPPAKPAATPAPPAKPAATPAPPAKPAAAPAPPAKPAAAPAPPAKPAAAPAPPAKPAAAPAPPAKPAAAPAPPAKKETVQAKPVPAKQAVKRKSGAYSLQIGDYVPDKTLATVEAKLKKNGVTPLKKTVVSAAEPMKRLFVAEFDDQDSAEAELQKLKKKTSDAFLIAENSRYYLYAGSYFSESRVRSQVQRLAAHGVKPVVKQATVQVKVTRLTAGSYATAADANNAAKRLQKSGIRAKVVKTGK